MKARITESLLKDMEAKAGAGRSFVWDNEVAGFGVRVGAKSKAFIVKSRVGQRQSMVTIGIHKKQRADGNPWTVTLARRRAKELLGQMAAGVDIAAGERRGGPTLREGLELHLSNLRKRRKSDRTIETMESDVRRIMAGYMDKPIYVITGHVLGDICNEIVRKAGGPKLKTPAGNPRGAAQANRLALQISAIWNSLDRAYELEGRNPARSVTRYNLKPRNTRVSHNKFRLWHEKAESADGRGRAAQFLALFSGVRSNGLAHLKFSDLDTGKRLLHITNAKGAHEYTVPACQTVLDVMLRKKRENKEEYGHLGGFDDWVFPTISSKGLGIVPAKKLNRTGLQSLHDLRRTYNSVAIEIGCPDVVRKQLMDHEGSGVNRKHYFEPESWELAYRWQSRIEKAIWERIRS